MAATYLRLLDTLDAYENALRVLLDWADAADSQIESEWGIGEPVKEPEIEQARALLDGEKADA